LACKKALSEPALSPKLQSTRGGVSETELKELAVSPKGVPSAARVVTMVTPVANRPKAERIACGLGAWL
jgi:hypothetical protein